jgi:hypothetical protein
MPSSLAGLNRRTEAHCYSTSLLGKLGDFVVAAMVAHALNHLFGGLPMLTGFVRIALRELKPRRLQMTISEMQPHPATLCDAQRFGQIALGPDVIAGESVQRSPRLEQP